VRGEKRVKEFAAAQQAQYVLDIQKPSFKEEITELATHLNATVCFDCYGGDVSGIIFNSLPQNSKQFCYGSLVSPFINHVGGIELRWRNKVLQGFVLFSWLASLSAERLGEVKQKVIDGI
jgi:NADPH:quinone reductase-like Zn-dependent oxidoreductase